MKIKVVTTLAKKKLNCVKKHWNEELLSAVFPPFPPVSVKSYEGLSKGSKTAVELNFLVFKARVVNEVVEWEESEHVLSMTEIGREFLPSMKNWKQAVTIEQKGEDCVITDELEYGTGVPALDMLFYPSMKGIVLYRQRRYKSYFDKKCS